MEQNKLASPTRRGFLASTAAIVVLGLAGRARAHSYRGGSMPWVMGDGPPQPVTPGGWYFFTPQEVLLLSAIADRLIPADALSPSASKAGVIVFLDRQLVGSYGNASRLYRAGPFLPGLPTQGYQGKDTPAERFRRGLAGIAAAVEAKTPGKKFSDWTAADQDAFLTDLEAGKATLPGGVDGKAFFAFMLSNVMEGFFADPIYGGNVDMVAWKMIGFPGARYDYLAWIPKHNQRYDLPPVSIQGSADWSVKGN